MMGKFAGCQADRNFHRNSALNQLDSQHQPDNFRLAEKGFAPFKAFFGTDPLAKG